MDNIISSINNISIDDTKLSKKQQIIDTLFNPDINGISRWVSKDEIENEKTLNWGANGIGRHGVYFNDVRYIWEKYPLKGKISKLRTIGFCESTINKLNRPIHNDIHKYHKSGKCVVCGSSSELVTDHKNDLYNDPRVLDINTQTIDDFQCLCNSCNLKKRQVAKKTLETKKRYGATNIPSLKIFGIDFIQGDENFDINDINAMKGTFWYDPIEFMKYIKDNILTKICIDIKAC